MRGDVANLRTAESIELQLSIFILQFSICNFGLPLFGFNIENWKVEIAKSKLLGASR
jgi:hypothetical protein